MSKNKPKKSAKPEEKLNAKEHDDEKNKEEEDQPGDGGRKPQPAEEKWSDWIWDEEMKLYYRAKHGTGDEWIYDYAWPDVHPATKKETANIISEKFEFPKVEEKIVFVEPKYKFEVPGTKGSEYLVSVCEEMRAGPGMGGGSGKPVGVSAGEKVVAAVKVEGRANAGEREEGDKNLEKSVDDDRGKGGVKKQPEKEGKMKKKDRDRHHERKEGKHKEKRK